MDIKKTKIYGLYIAIYVFFLIIKMTGNVIPINLYFAASLSLGFSLIYFLFKIKKSGIKFNNKVIPLWFFIIYNFISLAWTRAPAYGMTKLFILLSILIISFLISNLLTGRVSIFIKLFTFGSIAILIWYLSINGFKKINLSNQFFRLDLKENLNPIIIAQYFCFSILTFIFYLKFYKLKAIFKILIYLGIGISFVLTFLTGSKGPIIALLFALVLPYAISKFFWIRLNGKSVFLFFLVLLAIFFFVGPLISGNTTSGLSNFIERRYWGNDAATSVTSRIDILNFSFDHILKQPIVNLIFGNGIGDFGYAFTGHDQPMYPHNILVEILFESGLVGLSIFILLIFKVIQFNFKISKMLFLKNYENKSLYYYLSLFYFFLVGAMTTGDISNNFFVFVSSLCVLDIYQLFNSKRMHKQKLVVIEKNESV